MTGEGPIEKNRPSPIKWETFTSFSGLSPLLWETFTIFGQDLHRNTLFPTLRAPNGPSDVPSRAFAASFAPKGPPDGPLERLVVRSTLRANSCKVPRFSVYPAGKPTLHPHDPLLSFGRKPKDALFFQFLSGSVILCAVGLRKKCGRWEKCWQTYRIKYHYMKKSAVDQHVFFPSTALVSGIYRTIPRHLPHLAE